MYYTKYDVDIIVNGKPITKYNHKSDTFIEGRPDSEYKIRISNKTSNRIKAVISVDGLSILDGEPASASGRGYIINAHSTQVFDGWRISDDHIRKFKFGSKKQSYANKTGNGTTNVGVIGVAIYPELKTVTHHYRGPLVTYNAYNPSYYETNDGWRAIRGIQASSISPEVYTSNSSFTVGKDQTVAMAAIGSINNIGTEMGETVVSHVDTVSFNPGSVDGTYIIYYDDRKGLESRGIVVDTRHLKPDPFPSSNTYCRQV